MNRSTRAIGVVLALSLALALPALAAGSAYSDVPASQWYAEAVEYCRTNDLMNGVDDTRFDPEAPVTRAMAVTVLYRLAGSPAAEGGFTDVKAGAWYADAAAWAAQTGVSTGYSDGSFRPEQPVTREEFASFLWRAAGSPSEAASADFADADRISGWAAQAAAWVNAQGLITGKTGNRFDPLASASRAETATILMRRHQGTGAPAAKPETTETKLGKVEIATNTTLGANGIARMSGGELLVTDIYHQQIWRVANGSASVYAGGTTPADPYGQPLGGYNDAELKSSYFHTPWAVAPYQDGWAVTDTDNGALRLLTSAGVKTVSKTLTHPTGLAAGDDGEIYVADTSRGIIQKVDAEGRMTQAASGLDEPTGLCWSNGELYFAETGANRIMKLDRNGKPVLVAGSGDDGNADGPTASASFSGPQGIAVGSDGAIYVADTGNSAIRRIQSGKVSTIAVRSQATEDLTLVRPVGLLVEGNTLYICDSFARALLKMSV